jgi:hypothetical protein
MVVEEAARRRAGFERRGERDDLAAVVDAIEFGVVGPGDIQGGKAPWRQKKPYRTWSEEK